MKDSNIAKVYANTFIELAISENIDVAKELTDLTAVINMSSELENVLFLEVFTDEEKISVFSDVSKKIGLSQTIESAVKYLINEKRIGLLPLIYKEVIVQDDAKKGFLRGIVEGSTDDLSGEYRDKLIAAIKKEVGDVNPILSYEKNENITAGYKVTVGDLQLDATVDNQLKSFKESILGK